MTAVAATPEASAASAPSVLLDAKNVTMQFGGLRAVNDVSMEVKSGEIIGLIGPNGAGKTTFFNCLTGQYKPTAGSVIFDGQPLPPKPRRVVNAGMARTFQNIRLFHNMTALENVMVGRYCRTKSNALDAVFVQQLAGFFFVGALLDGDQTLFGRHHIAYGGFQTVFKAHVTGSHDADQVAILQDRNAGDVVLTGQFEQFTDGCIRLDRDGLFNHTGFEALDLADFVSLLLDGHVLVDDTDTAFLSHGDCQTGFSYGVHCSGNQRNIQFNATGQTSL